MKNCHKITTMKANLTAIELMLEVGNCQVLEAKYAISDKSMLAPISYIHRFQQQLNDIKAIIDALIAFNRAEMPL